MNRYHPARILTTILSTIHSIMDVNFIKKNVPNIVCLIVKHSHFQFYTHNTTVYYRQVKVKVKVTL